MPFRPTWAAMFEPEKYPPPPLTGFGFAWRYAVAIGCFFAMAAVWVLAFQARTTGVILDVPIPPEEIGSLRNAHFRDDVAAGTMVFDYRLRPGVCPTTNALKIMSMNGLPV